MLKLLNKLFRQLGYVPCDKTRETLYQMMKESARRRGQMIETDMGYIRVKVAAMDITIV